MDHSKESYLICIYRLSVLFRNIEYSETRPVEATAQNVSRY